MAKDHISRIIDRFITTSIIMWSSLFSVYLQLPTFFTETHTHTLAHTSWSKRLCSTESICEIKQELRSAQFIRFPFKNFTSAQACKRYTVVALQRWKNSFHCVQTNVSECRWEMRWAHRLPNYYLLRLVNQFTNHQSTKFPNTFLYHIVNSFSPVIDKTYRFVFIHSIRPFHYQFSFNINNDIYQHHSLSIR